MDMLKGLGSQFEKHAKGLTDKLNTLKDNYLGAVYELPHYRVSVKRLIAEGGFGFVFFVKEIGTERPFALKRMVVQERERLKVIKNEIATLKQLSKSRNVVKLEDVKIIENTGPSGRDAEVLLLMEFCSYSLLDIMNQRFTENSPLNEKEIYKIFAQICDGVEFMHEQHPPIAHRDLKVENVLYQENDRLFKLCDFGSATTVTYLPTTERERSVAEDDFNRNTTMMYRSPEMVDLYLKQKIDEKVDIWALGCILYKMAFGSDPFEAGRLAILNAKYTIPEFHKFSPTFLEFVAYLLITNPEQRPNIHQVQERLAQIRGVAYKKQNVPTSKPLPNPGSQPAATQRAAPAQVQTQPKPQPQPQQQQQPATPKGLFDSLVDEQSAPNFFGQQPSRPQAQTQQPSQQQRQPVQQQQQQPKPSSDMDDLLNWSTTPAPAPSNPSQRISTSGGSVPTSNPQAPNISRSAGSVPTTKAASFDFEWSDNTAQSNKGPSTPTKSAFDDFDPFGAGASSPQAVHQHQPQHQPKPQPPQPQKPHSPAPATSAGDDLLAFDDPKSAQKGNVVGGIAGLKIDSSTTSHYVPPGYKMPPNMYGGPRPYYSPQPAHPHNPQGYFSPQQQHPGFVAPPGPYAKPYPQQPPYGFAKPPPQGAVNLQIPPFKPQQPTRNTADIDDFDPLGPNANKSPTPQSQTPTKPTSAKASDMIDFF